MTNLEAVDWNTPVDTFTRKFYDQNKNQFWVPEEFSIPLDLPSWNKLTDDERDVYIHVLGGLTLLDTEQTEEGMLHVAKATDHSQRKALLMFMGAMEGIHADSYSTIFQTLSSKSERNELFEWVKGNKNLQYKAKAVVTYYRALDKIDYTHMDLAKAYVASVFLETFLFYSGFYYPLYQYGQGKVMQSGDVINMIIRDESIHGAYIGLLFQELFRDKLNGVEKEELHNFTIEFLEDLYANEVEYTDSVYNKIGLSADVKAYVRYNANKAMMNLGFEAYFDEKDCEFSSIVLNGLDTKTKNSDFFSQKQNGYTKAIVTPLEDRDFVEVLKLPQFN
ncbi:class 1b ribonucleoside-diphosphate reductase subunit beta [Staphylococcus gallinarum]|uniref:class 1b ribonucleoside-diphosphate reductase subunit beta n=1 Tax=Staphylococcus gallinarum TaxID=1293 RepID=UPI0030C2951E